MISRIASPTPSPREPGGTWGPPPFKVLDGGGLKLYVGGKVLEAKGRHPRKGNDKQGDAPKEDTTERVACPRKGHATEWRHPQQRRLPEKVGFHRKGACPEG